MDRTATAAHCLVALGIVFELPEVGLHVRVTPALAALVAPVVVFLGVAAHEQIAVDRAGAADDAAAHPALRLVVEVGLRFGLVLPGVAFVVEDLRDHQRDFEIDVVRRATCLKEQHSMAAVIGQACGKRGAGGAGANHDEIKLGVVRNGVRVHRKSPPGKAMQLRALCAFYPAGRPLGGGSRYFDNNLTEEALWRPDYSVILVCRKWHSGELMHPCDGVSGSVNPVCSNTNTKIAQYSGGQGASAVKCRLAIRAGRVRPWRRMSCHRRTRGGVP